MTHRKTIGSNIRRIRKELGWSQERLADKAFMDRDYIGRLERAQVNVSIDTLAIIAKALKVGLSSLLDGLR